MLKGAGDNIQCGKVLYALSGRFKVLLCYKALTRAFFLHDGPAPACMCRVSPSRYTGIPKIILANFYRLIRHSKYIRFTGVKLAFYTFDYEVAWANDMIAL